jgi:NAD(P)-dependent dehydrogenase (short-subunit alcohol dehydrogenase family)
MKITFKGKIALVTGAGTGIGKAIANAFGSLGATIVAADIDSKKCAALRTYFKRKKIKSLVVQTDVCKGDQVKALRKEIQKKYGKLDILVNNVGHHLGIFTQLENSTDEEWQELYDINLRHMFVVTRAMIPLLRKGSKGVKGANIINLSSIEGFRACPTNVIYTTMKWVTYGSGFRLITAGPTSPTSPVLATSGFTRAMLKEHRREWLMAQNIALFIGAPGR